MIFTAQNYDPIARMNAAKDRHRARGTTGGKGNAVKIDRRNMTYCPIRDAVQRMRLATEDALEQYRFDVFLAPEFLPTPDGWVSL